MFARLATITLLLLVTAIDVCGQDSASIGNTQLPRQYLDHVTSKAQSIEQRLNNKADKSLQKMMRLEQRMKKKLASIDSSRAKELFGDVKEKYSNFQKQLEGKISVKQYLPSLDTLSSSLRFIGQNQELISKVKDGEKKLKKAIGKVNGLETEFQKAEELKKFLKERRQFLKQQLDNLGFAKELKRLNKEVYYYSQQVNEYKSLLKDHKKAERKALELLGKTKVYKDFMRKNSTLASLFRLPGDPSDPVAQANLAGLQTRTQVNNLIQQQFSSGGGNAQAQFRQNIQDAQNQINQLKNKLSQFGGGNSDDMMPEGFKPNDQRTKSLFQRLELGINFQTQRATNFFPVTSDIGLSLGYKLNDKSVIGIGASYKMGWGSGWNHIQISSQGAGLRSFIDWKIKGSLWITGGYEQNYRSAFSDFSQLRDIRAWQQSGLIGLSKVISLKTQFFKKTKLQLLWDFLSYQQTPKTQPVVFRIGYNLQ